MYINQMGTVWKLLIVSFFVTVLAACNDRETKDEVFYFVMPDRFANGSTSNDTGGIDGDRSDHGYDATDHSYYHGGDLRGLKKKLPYLDKLGVTSIWMTPIFKNAPVSIDGTSAAYHGYWAQDYMQVDPHLGTNRELRAFIRAAHRRDIKVFFDIVVNHTADIIRYEECHNPDGSFPGSVSGCAYRDTSTEAYTPFVPEGYEFAKSPEWLNNPDYYHNRGDSSFAGESSLLGDFFGLDDIDTDNPVVVEGMIDIFKYWISEFQIDGFRLDTVKHVNIEFWQQWTPAIKDHAAEEGIDDFFVFGEIFDGNPAAISRYTTEGKLDSAVDFGLHFAMRDVFANNVAPVRLEQMFDADDFYTDTDSDASTLLSFASNHDVGRIAYNIQNNNPDESDEQHLARLQQAYALMYFGRGIPVIYYGDEQGFVGGGDDREAREDMMPSLVDSFNRNDLIGTDKTTADNNFDRRHPMYRTLRSYKRVLDLHPTLRRGRQHARYASAEPGIFAFSRVDDESQVEYLVVMNTSSEERSVVLDATAESYYPIYPYGYEVPAVGGQIDLTVPGFSTVVYKAGASLVGPSLDQVSLGLQSNAFVSGRFEVPALVSWLDDHPLPMTKVEFFASVDGGEAVSLGADYNNRYRVFYDASALSDGTQITFSAVATDQHGFELSAEDVTVQVGLAPGLELVFKAPEGWGENANIHYWQVPTLPDSAWPGVAMESLGAGWFKFNFPDGAASANIIFNDGEGNQTNNLFRDSNGCYIDLAWQNECQPPVPGIEITFLKPDSWGNNVNMYYWDAAPEPDADWPGVPMENLIGNWYRLQLPLNVTSANIIFNDGEGNQTTDLSRAGSGCFIDSAWVDACEVPIPGIKVSFLKPEGWGENVNIHFWDAAPATDTNWPGVPATNLGNGVYEYQFANNVASANIIFNDGEGNQTVDLFRDADGCFNGEAWVTSCEVAGPESFRVNFFRPDGWGEDINLYYWQADPIPDAAWPGVPMLNLGGGWYTFEFPEGVSNSNIIFNDGQGNQTADLNRSGAGCYIASDWVDTCDAPLPGIKVSFLKPDGWGLNVNIHYWNAAPASDTEWPGAQMTDLGNGIYEYQFPADVRSANLIFNDGEGNQTQDLSRENTDGCFDGSEWQTVCEITGGGFRVNFLKPEGWSDSINIHYWQAVSIPGTEWPGIPMLALGDNWYTFEFPSSVVGSNMIFNDGNGNQTADLNRTSDGCYIDAAWVDSCDAPLPGLLLTFRKPASWGDNINVYYWQAGPVPDADWPGAMMEEVANGWYQFRLPAGATSANIIFNDGQGSQSSDLFRDSDGCYGIDSSDWIDSCEVPEEVEIIDIAAHWVESGALLWNAPAGAETIRLYSSSTAALDIDGDQMNGADLTVDLGFGGAASDFALEKFRHLASLPAFQVSLQPEQLRQALQGQLVVAAFGLDGAMIEATRVQVPGIIDENFQTAAPLGVQYDGASVSLSLWAPTAQSVALNLYDTEFNLVESLAPSSDENGTYTFVGDSSWTDLYYRFALTVYHPVSDQIESYEITDPYSISLSLDSQYSQIVNLEADDSLKPAGWDAIVKALPEHEDITIYEGHVRDFSSADELVAQEHRGKYLAFTYNGEDGRTLSHGMNHLKNLRSAGLSHFHLLPVNDLASVSEDPAQKVDLDDPYSRLCELSTASAVQDGCVEFADMTVREALVGLAEADPVNTRIQSITSAMRALDSFNWGYDPYHFLAIEGGYANDIAGKNRILEFREMVKALDQVDLKVVVDVVFNHTNASGLWNRSVLDRAVPGYYHRLDPVSGAVANSTCCDNTAAEHAMMERLMIDTLILWAKQYKIDAFRFDLMGHHPRSTMENIKAALAQLTPEADGVLGSNIYLYGEGWDFGEVSGNQRFDQATQFNMGGTGIGTFNDRLRGAVRGGNFTDNGRAQGFANGNGTYANGVANGASAVGDQGDRIRIGLAGNLRSYAFTDNSGAATTGEQYSGVGYTLAPQENVVYVDKHDNEGLWDNTQAKLPDDVSNTDRVRIHALSQAFVNLSQGVPFHQMGSDILRSKSMHRNSYDAGDWINQVDFSLVSSNWAKGLPEASENSTRWPTMTQVMTNPNITPSIDDRQLATDMFQEQLQVRYSSQLFRLPTATDVEQRIAFWNTGASQLPGVIAMTISDGACAGSDLDGALDGVAVIFNADDDEQSVTIAGLAGSAMSLHDVQQFSADDIVLNSSYDVATGTFSIPGQTAAVFVAPQGDAQGSFPCNPLAGIVLTPGFKVFFEAPADWTSANAYYWDAAPSGAGVDWPGVAMESIGESWYSFQFPDGVTAANIIFNNNAGGQTADLFREGDGCFSNSAGVWADTCDVPGMILTFQKPADWGADMHVHFWNAAVANPEWPGTPMVDLGEDTYSLQLPRGVRASNIIFHDNNGNQTADLFRDRDGCYDLVGGWADSCPAP